MMHKSYCIYRSWLIQIHFRLDVIFYQQNLFTISFIFYLYCWNKILSYVNALLKVIFISKSLINRLFLNFFNKFWFFYYHILHNLQNVLHFHELPLKFLGHYFLYFLCISNNMKILFHIFSSFHNHNQFSKYQD